MATPEKVTEAQAGEALRALVQSSHEDDDEPRVEVKPEEVEEPAPEPEPEPPKAAAEPAAEAVVTEPSESDDVASLKLRLQEREKQLKDAESIHESRWKAIQERSAANERILRERFLKKATMADRALKTLEAARTEQGIPEAEVDRVIRELRSTMHPESPSYAPPPEVQPAAQEDSNVILNTFLNEKGMTAEEEQAFGKWMKTEGATVLSDREQALAGRDLDGFLRIAHVRYEAGLREKVNQRNETIAAVKTVQRVQKEAAKAAAPTSAPRKQPTAPRSDQPDWKKMSKAEQKEMVSALLKQSVEQYR